MAMATDVTATNKLAEVWGDQTALFILHKVAEMGNTTLDTLDKNLKAPHGWVSLAKVWRADLIDIIGDYVTLTEAGAMAETLLQAMIADEKADEDAR